MCDVEPSRRAKECIGKPLEANREHQAVTRLATQRPSQPGGAKGNEGAVGWCLVTYM